VEPREAPFEEIIEALAEHGERDDDVFRYYTTSYVAQDGSIHHKETLYITVGELREIYQKLCLYRDMVHPPTPLSEQAHSEPGES